jgi:hypothetical protein
MSCLKGTLTMPAKQIPIAVWSNLNLRHIELCAENGFTRTYPSLVPGATTHEAFPEPDEGYDALAKACEKAHEYGMEVHPYLPVFLLPTFMKDDYWLYDCADKYCERQRDGSPGVFAAQDYHSGTMYSYAYPEVRQFFVDVHVKMANEFPIDGVMLDYIRFPGDEYIQCANGVNLLGYADPMVESFREKTGLDARKIPNNHPDWMHHRADFVTQTIREIREALPKRDGKQMEISACTGGWITKDLRIDFRDWRSWVQQGVVDTLCPMIYKSPEVVWRGTKAIRETLRDEENYTLLSSLAMRAGITTPELLREGYKHAMGGGADGICIYRVEPFDDAGLWDAMSTIREDIPAPYPEYDYPPFLHPRDPND